MYSKIFIYVLNFKSTMDLRKFIILDLRVFLTT